MHRIISFPMLLLLALTMLLFVPQVFAQRPAPAGGAGDDGVNDAAGGNGDGDADAGDESVAPGGAAGGDAGPSTVPFPSDLFNIDQFFPNIPDDFADSLTVPTSGLPTPTATARASIPRGETPTALNDDEEPTPSARATTTMRAPTATRTRAQPAPTATRTRAQPTPTNGDEDAQGPEETTAADPDSAGQQDSTTAAAAAGTGTGTRTGTAIGRNSTTVAPTSTTVEVSTTSLSTTTPSSSAAPSASRSLSSGAAPQVAGWEMGLAVAVVVGFGLAW